VILIHDCEYAVVNKRDTQTWQSKVRAVVGKRTKKQTRESTSNRPRRLRSHRPSARRTDRLYDFLCHATGTRISVVSCYFTIFNQPRIYADIYNRTTWIRFPFRLSRWESRKKKKSRLLQDINNKIYACMHAPCL